MPLTDGYLWPLFPCLSIAIQEGGVQSQLFAVAPHHRVQQGIQHLEPHLNNYLPSGMERITLNEFKRLRQTCSTEASLIISSHARTLIPGLQSLAILEKTMITISKRHYGFCSETVEVLLKTFEELPCYRGHVIKSYVSH